MLNKILNFFIYLIVVVSFLLFFFFQKNIEYIFIIFSAFCLLIGICYILKRNKIGTLSFGIGMSGFVSYYIYIKNYLIIYDCITFMVCLSASIILFLTLVFMFLNHFYYKKKYSILLNAEVVDILQQRVNKKDCYKPIYTYTLNQNKYTVEYVEYISKFVPNIGDKKIIYVSSVDPLDVYFPPEKIKSLINILSCLSFIILSIIILLSLF